MAGWKKPRGRHNRGAPENVNTLSRGAESGFELGLGQADGALTFLPLTAFLMSFTRSKRLRTERLPPTVPVALSVECLDIYVCLVKVNSASLRKCGRFLYSRNSFYASQISDFFSLFFRNSETKFSSRCALVGEDSTSRCMFALDSPRPEEYSTIELREV